MPDVVGINYHHCGANLDVWCVRVPLLSCLQARKIGSNKVLPEMVCKQLTVPPSPSAEKLQLRVHYLRQGCVRPPHKQGVRGDRV